MNFYLACLLFFFPHLIQAQSDSFIYPQSPGPTDNFSQNLVWELGSPVTIKWMSDFPSYNLIILQSNDVPDGQPGSDAGGVSISTRSSLAPMKISNTHTETGTTDGSGQQEVSFNWTVTTSLNFVTYPVFWFQLYNDPTPTSATAQINSHYFNITSSSSTASTSTSSTSTSPTATTSHSPTSAPKAGLSAGGKVGISIGIIIPIFIIAIFIAGWYWRRSRRSKMAVGETSEPSEYQKPELAAIEA